MLTKKDLAQRLGVSQGTIGNYVTHGMPGTKRQGNKGVPVWSFDLILCQEWVKDYKNKPKPKGTTTPSRDEADQELVEARTKKVQYEARIKELEMLVAEERYVDIKEVEQAYVNELTIVRTKLLAMPSKLAPLILGFDDPRQPEAILLKEINEILEDFCES